MEIKEENILPKDKNKESTDMNDTPSLVLNKIGYNCSECSSIIEILSLDENDIEFKCNNKHNIKMKIKEYLEKMKKYNDKKANGKICDKHNEEYLSYCFECNNHLCKKCLKSGEHSYHYKMILMEIMPSYESLNKIND